MRRGRERMFIYGEDLARTGETLTNWGKAPEAEWAPVGKPLVARAITRKQAFTIPLMERIARLG